MLVAMAFLRFGDRFFFQRRSDDPRKGAAGMIGCFGGKIAAGEGALGAVVREVAEETTLALDPSAFHYLGTVEVTSDHNLEPVRVEAEVFLAELGTRDGFEAVDGALVSLGRVDIERHLPEMTPATRAACQRYSLGQSQPDR